MIQYFDYPVTGYTGKITQGYWNFRDLLVWDSGFRKNPIRKRPKSVILKTLTVSAARLISFSASFCARKILYSLDQLVISNFQSSNYGRFLEEKLPCSRKKMNLRLNVSFSHHKSDHPMNTGSVKSLK